MTKLEMLCKGVQEIAANHGFNSNVDYENEGGICIWGGCNVPTLNDVQMLMDDLGMCGDDLYPSEFGIDITIPSPDEWDGSEEYVKKPGMELWRPNLSPDQLEAYRAKQRRMMIGG